MLFLFQYPKIFGIATINISAIFWWINYQYKNILIDKFIPGTDVKIYLRNK